MATFKERVKTFLNPRQLAILILDRIAFLFADKTFLKIEYYLRIGKTLNLKNPQTFNEKLQWLKLHNRKPEYTQMVDKIGAKDFVSAIIGSEYIIPTIACYDSVEDIDWSTLPNQFVIKCTHDSGGLVVCKDKSSLDLGKAKKTLNWGLKRDYYYQNREWPYKNVPHKLICEKYMEDESGYELKDYKFFCFNGRCEFFKIDFDRQKSHHANYFNRDCELMPFGEVVCPPDYNRELKIPSNIGEMINKAEQIAVSINNAFVRVDLYNINGQVYFGEITFYPASGVGKFEPEEWDFKLGEMIKLPSQPS